VFRAGGVASRSSIQTKITTNGLRAISRSFQNNLADPITSFLPPSPDVGTASVEPAFVAFIASDLTNDVRALTGFVHTSDYGTRKILHEQELGTWEDFRFVSSPHLGAYLLAGGTGAAANTVLANGVANSAGTEAADVYPIIVLSERAYGDVMLRGMDSFSMYHRRPGGGDQANSSPDDPLNQRGHVGAKFYMTAVLLNQLQMAVYEVACSYVTA
jgi:N4-gp56 family major capsid protein